MVGMGHFEFPCAAPLPQVSTPGRTTLGVERPRRSAEDGIAAGRQWSDLSERTRRLLAITAVAEGALKLAALIDLKRRPASQVRGPKWMYLTERLTDEDTTPTGPCAPAGPPALTMRFIA
jgi:hypothetical protein